MVVVLSAKPFEPTEQDLQDLRDHLGLCGDENVKGVLAAAVAMVEERTGKVLRKKTISFHMANGPICVPYDNVQSIDEIKIVGTSYLGDADYQAYSHVMGDYKFNRKCVHNYSVNLCLPKLCSPCLSYEVTYTACPDKHMNEMIRYGIFEIARTLYDGEDLPDLPKLMPGLIIGEAGAMVRALGGITIDVL